MHHCLRISEVLILIFEFVGCFDDRDHWGRRLDKTTLASLARTCHLFNLPALDILWRELHSFRPLLKIFPVDASSMDDAPWLTVRKYAKRIRIIHGSEERTPVPLKKSFIHFLQSCPKACLPLLPNVNKVEWSEFSLAPREDSSILLLRYFAGPAVTTITLSLVRWLAYSPIELAVLADLPKLCPNVTSFSISLSLSWDYEPTREVGRMVTQLPRLRTLRTCAIAQSMMEELFTRQTLETLYIDFHESSPVYVGRIPNWVRELSLNVERPGLCTRFFQTTHASPTKLRLLIGMNERKEETEIEEMSHLLPRRLDTSRLQSLTIRPQSSIAGIPMWNSLELRPSLVSALVEFTALRELDLDLLCTAQVSDTDYACMAASLTRLRSLKLGTANPSIARSRPAASVRAVIAVLTHCKQLETLHIVFDGTIPPQRGLTLKKGDMTLSRDSGCLEWGVSNRRITKLCVGDSPIMDVTISPMASCFRSILPCLARIEYQTPNENWRAVQNILDWY